MTRCAWHSILFRSWIACIGLSLLLIVSFFEDCYKYNFTEQDAWQLCEDAGLLSPVYEFTDRGGCWFCPNAKRAELRHLYDCHPDLWARMLALQAIPGKTTEKFNRTQKFSDIDAMFRQEDEETAQAAA